MLIDLSVICRNTTVSYGKISKPIQSDKSSVAFQIKFVPTVRFILKQSDIWHRILFILYGYLYFPDEAYSLDQIRLTSH